MMTAFALLFVAHSSHAINCIRANPVENYRDFIHKIAVVDENGRMTEDEYAAKKVKPLSAVQNRFAATGELRCGSRVLTAQLTGASNVITTAAHAFFDPRSCAKKSEPESCSFTAKVGNVKQVSKVSSVAGMGFNCPRIPQPNEDWAVLKLESNIDDVTPYELPSDDKIESGEAITAVSAGADDFARIDPKTKKKIYPKTIEDCETRKVYAYASPIYFESNCDFARGNSGGSILKTIGGRDVLIGISSANDEKQRDLDRAIRRGKPNDGPYKEGKWATYHVPLNGDFLKTVESAIGEISL